MDISRATTHADSGNAADLRSTLVLLWARRWWILMATVIVLLAAMAVQILTTPLYRASVVMVPAFPDRETGVLSSALGQLGGLASLAGFNVSSTDSETEEALAVLRSRSFTERFIVEKNLLPLLFPGSWDAARNQWKTRPPTLARAFRRFDEKVRTVVEDKKTGLITLEIDWRDGVAGAAWANELVARLNAEMRRRAITNADAAVQYLQKELPNSSEVSIRDAINRLVEAQIKQRMLATVTQEYAFRVVDHALPADPQDPLWPKRWLLLLGGAVLGLFVGIFIVLFHQMMVRR